MKKLIYALAVAISIQLVHAEDLSFAFEGDAQQRQRLASLQGAATPPEWHLTRWENSPALSKDALKGKIIVLDFWATWCGPCIASIPHNNEILKKYKDDVVFIGVCHPEGSENMKGVIQTQGIKYPVAVDADGKTIKAYRVNGYPDYYIVDRDGSLVVADCSNSKVEQVLSKLLKKPVTQASEAIGAKTAPQPQR